MRTASGFVALGLALAACGGRTYGGAQDASIPHADAGEAGPPVESGTLDSGMPSEAGPTEAGATEAGPADAGFDEGDGCDSQQAAAPTFSPPAGTYTCTQQVVLSTTTPGATIVYGINGLLPGSTMEYTGPIPVVSTQTIEAYATAPCMRDSTVAQAQYVVNIVGGTPGPPYATVQSGTDHADFDVSLTSYSPGATICYTLDGTQPTCSSDTGACTNGTKTYSAAAEIAIDATVTNPVTGSVVLQAGACEASFCVPGLGGPLTYTLQLDPIALAPAAGAEVPDGGTLSGVQITENGPTTDQPYASICWSTDGATMPDCTCNGATPANTAAVLGPGLYVTTGNTTPLMQLQEPPGATGITLRAVGCATGYAPSDAPYATITWH